MTDRPGEHLEPLFVLDPAPRNHQLLSRLVGIRRGRQPLADVDSVGHQVDLLGRQFEPVGDLADHELRAGDHLMGLVGQPPLHGIDRCRRALWHVAAVPASFGGVDRGDQRHAPQRLEGVCRPGHEPVVGVDDLRSPRTQAAPRVGSGGGWPTPSGQPGNRREAMEDRRWPEARERLPPSRRRRSRDDRG